MGIQPNLTSSQRTVEYIKAKEKDLDGIVHEYRSNATAFLDKVEKLHQRESNTMVGLVKKQRQTFVESCRDGSKVCREFMGRLERCSVSTGGSGGLEDWLGQGRDMQRELGAA